MPPVLSVPGLPNSIIFIALGVMEDGEWIIKIYDRFGVETSWLPRSGFTLPLPEQDILNLVEQHIRVSMGKTRRN